MSYLTVYAIWPGERHAELREFRNSWGGAIVVWGKMFAHYVETGPDAEWKALTRGDEVWPLSERADIPGALRRVLMMTYDRVYIARENYARAGSNIREFLAAFPIEDDRVNHRPAIVQLFEANPDWPAIGFRWTSVSEDLFQGEYNEATDDYDPPGWSQMWELYSEFDAKSAEAQ